MNIERAVINYGRIIEVSCNADDVATALNAGNMHITQGENTIMLCDEELMELATFARMMGWESFENYRP